MGPEVLWDYGGRRAARQNQEFNVSMIQTTPNIPPSVDDSSTNMAAALDSSKIKTPGHQGDENSGGVKVGYKVVFCSNMPISVDYELVYLLVKQYGKISRIRLILDNSKSSYNCYVVYENEKEARKAKEHLHYHSVNTWKNW